MNKLKDAIAKRGTNTVRGLALCFRCLDSQDGSRKIDREEFRVGLSELGISLTKPETDVRAHINLGFDELL